MRHQKVTARAIDRLKDEVYRQMLRLEAGRPAARVLLAVALLNAWTTLERQPAGCEPRQWLRKLSPVCLRMIRTEWPASVDAGGAKAEHSQDEP